MFYILCVVRRQNHCNVMNKVVNDQHRALLGALEHKIPAGSWHKGAHNRNFPCMEANYPYDKKNSEEQAK